MTCRCEPVGIPEIAARLGTTRSSISTWRARGQFPEPRWTVGGRPAWNWPDVEAWTPPRAHHTPSGSTP